MAAVVNFSNVTPLSQAKWCIEGLFDFAAKTGCPVAVDIQNLFLKINDHMAVYQKKPSIEEFRAEVKANEKKYPQFYPGKQTKTPSGHDWNNLLAAIERDDMIAFEKIFVPQGFHLYMESRLNKYPIYSIIHFNNAKKIANSLCLNLKFNGSSH